MVKNIIYSKKCKGVQFRIRETGMNFTLDVKDKKSKSFKRIQSVSDLRLGKKIIENQKECR
mgnify:FL=1